MADVDVSVVIPLYNRARLIPYTLESLCQENHPDVCLEVVVVDDGSQDGGAEVASRVYPTARVIHGPHRGAAAARNAGLRVARGEAVLFLDSDDLVETGFFGPRLKMLSDHPDAAGVYGPFDFFESDAAFQERLVRPRHSPYPIEAVLTRRSHMVRLLGGWYIVGPAIVWRTSVVREHGGYDEALRVNQDVELLFRILTTTNGIVGCVAPRALCRDHALGARQGVLGYDEGKASDLLTLRRRFASVLSHSELDGSDTRQALARYCFDRWEELRQSMPAIAEGFYGLSRSLDPDLQLLGRWILTLLSSVLGARRAAVLAGRLRGVRAAARSALMRWKPRGAVTRA